MTEEKGKQTVQDSQQVAQSDRGGISIVGDGNIIYATPSLDAAQVQSMRADYLESLRRRFEYLDLGGIAPRVQNEFLADDLQVQAQAGRCVMEWSSSHRPCLGRGVVRLLCSARALQHRCQELVRAQKSVHLANNGSGRPGQKLKRKG